MNEKTQSAVADIDVAQISGRATAETATLNRIELELRKLCDVVAAELHETPMNRDRALIGDTLVRIEKIRSQLHRAFRELVDATASSKPLHSAGSRRFRPGTLEQKATKRLQNGVKSRLRRWRSIMDCVEEQHAARRVPLYLAPRQRQGVQTAISDDIFLALHQFANPAEQHHSAAAHGCYSDIRMAPSEFIAHAHAAYRVLLAQGSKRPFRFLDVGCGGGVKVMLASRFFDFAQGLEYDPSYARAARNLFEVTKIHDCQILDGDALTFDDYPNYDVIYFYRPMSDDGKLVEMEKRIAARARPGTILIAPYDLFLNRSDSLRCPLIAGSIFLAQANVSDAKALGDAAEMSGTIVSQTGGDWDTGFWTPIIDVSRANGFAPLWRG